VRFSVIQTVVFCPITGLLNFRFDFFDLFQNWKLLKKDEELHEVVHIYVQPHDNGVKLSPRLAISPRTPERQNFGFGIITF
jgi:hypothetical protein